MSPETVTEPKTIPPTVFQKQAGGNKPAFNEKPLYIDWTQHLRKIFTKRKFVWRLCLLF